MKYNTILFDLDGTLTDPAEGITKSVAFSLDAYGVPYKSLDALRPFIGPPLREQFMKYTGFDVNTGEAMVEKYREYYAVTGIYENKVYDGIPEMLETLKKAGKTLAVATSKPERFAKIILEHFNISHYFDICAGANIDNTRTDKAEVIQYAIEILNKNSKSDGIVMVGDRMHDIIGAKKNSIECIGVTFGYGSVEELENANADIIVNSVTELCNTLMQ